jgi:hypothetical protein
MSPDDPTNDPNVEGDPYKTLFVARIVSTMAPITIWWGLSSISKAGYTDICLICSNAEANCVVLSDLFAAVRMKVFFSAFVTMLSW